mgnify:CR=1 FL=1
MSDPAGGPDDLEEADRAALHSVELGVEWLHRAHGDLVRFHHQVGHAMDHLAEAEQQFRDAGRSDLADAIRDEYLPSGVIDDDRWSYDVLESYEEGFLAELTAFEAETREAVADGRRHVAERHQERVWKRRAGGEGPAGAGDADRGGDPTRGGDGDLGEDADRDEDADLD